MSNDAVGAEHFSPDDLEKLVKYFELLAEIEQYTATNDWACVYVAPKDYNTNIRGGK